MNLFTLSLILNIHIVLIYFLNYAECQNSYDCKDILDGGDANSGIYTIYPFKCSQEYGIKVLCDQETDGGGWTVIQRRQEQPVRENFFRTWVEYEIGFGDMTGEFWLGLKNINALTSLKLMELRIDLEYYTADENTIKKIAKYDRFYIADDSDNYSLQLGTHSGDAADSFTIHSGHPFSTKDKDNDADNRDCSVFHKGAWWYNNCGKSNLNGEHVAGNDKKWTLHGIGWASQGNIYSLKKVSMLIRPKV